MRSLKSFGLSTKGCRDHGAINGLNVRDLLENHGPVVLLLGVRVDWVAKE